MFRLGAILSLAILALALSSAKANMPAWPDAPYGSIVAVAKLLSKDKSVVVRGTVALIWPRPGSGEASVSVNLTGAVNGITMVHVRLNTSGTDDYDYDYSNGTAPPPPDVIMDPTDEMAASDHTSIPVPSTNNVRSNDVYVRNPVRLDLWPRYPDPENAVPYIPPLNFRGIMGFTVPFDYLRVAAWDPSRDHTNFIKALSEQMLFVGVNTADSPDSVIQGTLVCRDPCFFSTGGGVVNPGR